MNQSLVSYVFTTTVYQLGVSGGEYRDTIYYQGDIEIEDTLDQRIRVNYRPNGSFSWKITEDSLVATCHTHTFDHATNWVEYSSIQHTSGGACPMGVVTDETRMSGDKL